MTFRKVNIGVFFAIGRHANQGNIIKIIVLTKTRLTHVGFNHVVGERLEASNALLGEITPILGFPA